MTPGGSAAVRVDGCDAGAAAERSRRWSRRRRSWGRCSRWSSGRRRGRWGSSELVALFWHCLREVPEEATREALGEAVAALRARPR
jgi:hypothetical protein